MLCVIVSWIMYEIGFRTCKGKIPQRWPTQCRSQSIYMVKWSYVILHRYKDVFKIKALLFKRRFWEWGVRKGDKNERVKILYKFNDVNQYTEHCLLFHLGFIINLSFAIDNLIYCMIDLLIYKYEPYWQEISVVTIKACGPLVVLQINLMFVM